MNRRTGFLPLLLSAVLVLGQRPVLGETIVVRGDREVPVDVESVLDHVGVKERFCYGGSCVVSTDDPAARAATHSLESDSRVSVEVLLDARKIHFARATYDADADAFDQPFPGADEVPPLTSSAQVALVLKSYPQAAWLEEIRSMGLLVSEPLAPMALRVFGARSAIQKLEGLRYVQKVREIPAGLKRFRIDSLPEWDVGGKGPTTVAFFDDATSPLRSLLEAASGSPQLPIAYTMSSVVAMTVPLTVAEAHAFSQMPEVVHVTRENLRVEPSDERATRIVAGTWQTPGSSWPTGATTPANPLPANSPAPGPYYWDTYLSNLQGIGLDLSNETIAFLDYGVEGGLQDGDEATCPEALRRTIGGCALLTTNDVTEDFLDPSLRATERNKHGAVTTSLAAGSPMQHELYIEDANHIRIPHEPGRDLDRYSFTQGIASGARVAVIKWDESCDGSLLYRSVNPDGAAFDAGHPAPRLRYSVVSLSRVGAFRDGAFGAGATLFNHSWNGNPASTDPTLYDELSMIIDKTARRLSAASFDFGSPNSPDEQAGSSAPALHVISAGNMDQYSSLPYVTTPANAKNGITVGAAEGLNPMAYGGFLACPQPVADIPRRIAALSRNARTGAPMKPDVVAPGTRVYGRRVDLGCSECFQQRLSHDDETYSWASGTSFAAPQVAGGAAVVREWLRAIGHPHASPALTKAALLAGAQSLVAKRPSLGTCCSTSTCAVQWICAMNRLGEQYDVRPSPDPYQGWGGLSFDRFFRSEDNYFFMDQAATGDYLSPSQSPTWHKTLYITDRTKPITVMLVWTDRFSDLTTGSLVNDLDLKVTMMNGATAFYGNVYYCDPNAFSRTAYSLLNPSCSAPLPQIPYDRTNNYERIDIKATQIPAEATTIRITVNGVAITADGLDPDGQTEQRQDFAIAVINAHE